MRVVVPFTDLRPTTAAALDATGHQWESVDVSGSDSDYCDLLTDLWRARESFIIVEHDVVVRPDTLRSLEECPEQWCSFGYLYSMTGGAYHGLGCVKFDATLLSSVPNAMDTVADMSDALHKPRHFCRLDAWLQCAVLPGAGARRCHHEPPLDHRIGGPSHGCVA